MDEEEIEEIEEIEEVEDYDELDDYVPETYDYIDWLEDDLYIDVDDVVPVDQLEEAEAVEIESPSDYVPPTQEEMPDLFVDYSDDVEQTYSQDVSGSGTVVIDRTNDAVMTSDEAPWFQYDGTSQLEYPVVMIDYGTDQADGYDVNVIPPVVGINESADQYLGDSPDDEVDDEVDNEVELDNEGQDEYDEYWEIEEELGF